MWIFLSDAFLSIVAYQGQPGSLLVRSRIQGDIEQVFPDATVQHTPDHDYAYRTILPRETISAVIAEQITQIAYPNFKNSVGNEERHRHYFGAYDAMVSIDPNLRRRRPRSQIRQAPLFR